MMEESSFSFERAILHGCISESHSIRVQSNSVQRVVLLTYFKLINTMVTYRAIRKKVDRLFSCIKLMTNIDGKNRHPGNAIEELKSTDYQNYVYMQIKRQVQVIFDELTKLHAYVFDDEISTMLEMIGKFLKDLMESWDTFFNGISTLRLSGEGHWVEKQRKMYYRLATRDTYQCQGRIKRVKERLRGKFLECDLRPEADAKALYDESRQKFKFEILTFEIGKEKELEACGIGDYKPSKSINEYDLSDTSIDTSDDEDLLQEVDQFCINLEEWIEEEEERREIAEAKKQRALKRKADEEANPQASAKKQKCDGCGTPGNTGTPKSGKKQKRGRRKHKMASDDSDTSDSDRSSDSDFSDPDNPEFQELKEKTNNFKNLRKRTYQTRLRDKEKGVKEVMKRGKENSEAKMAKRLRDNNEKGMKGKREERTKRKSETKSGENNEMLKTKIEERVKMSGEIKIRKRAEENDERNFERKSEECIKKNSESMTGKKNEGNDEKSSRRKSEDWKQMKREEARKRAKALEALCLKRKTAKKTIEHMFKSETGKWTRRKVGETSEFKTEKCEILQNSISDHKIKRSTEDIFKNETREWVRRKGGEESEYRIRKTEMLHKSFSDQKIKRRSEDMFPGRFGENNKRKNGEMTRSRIEGKSEHKTERVEMLQKLNSDMKRKRKSEDIFKRRSIENSKRNNREMARTRAEDNRERRRPEVGVLLTKSKDRETPNRKIEEKARRRSREQVKRLKMSLG